MESVALQPLNTLETSLNQLITSLTTTNTYSLAPVAAQSLLSADDALLSALETLRRHQTNYARILHLREEATKLEEQLKGIIRTCVDLKGEIAGISPGILTGDLKDESEEEDDKTNSVQEVDYKTLLTFAARIGKHNSLAALEAERESTRRKVEAAKSKKEGSGITNNVNSGGITNGTAQSPTNNADANATAESISEVNQLENRVAAQRAHLGMAFPDGEILRLGALGRLQVLREREGEDAVAREVERMVRGTEDVTEPTKPAGKGVIATGVDVSMSDDREEREDNGSSSREVQQRPATEQRMSQASRSAPAPAPARRKLDLDFPGSDDDDDD